MKVKKSDETKICTIKWMSYYNGMRSTVKIVLPSVVICYRNWPNLQPATFYTSLWSINNITKLYSFSLFNIGKFEFPKIKNYFSIENFILFRYLKFENGIKYDVFIYRSPTRHGFISLTNLASCIKMTNCDNLITNY